MHFPMSYFFVLNRLTHHMDEKEIIAGLLVGIVFLMSAVGIIIQLV